VFIPLLLFTLQKAKVIFIPTLTAKKQKTDNTEQLKDAV
jgi:hypothetical protein